MGRRTAALALVLAAVTPLRGQGRSPRVDVSRPDIVVSGTGVATTTISGMLTEGHRKEMLHGGWPTAIRGRLELWRRGGLFGTFGVESAFEWDVIVEYSPASKTYHLRRVIDNRSDELGEVNSIEAAEELLRKPFTPPLSPERS